MASSDKTDRLDFAHINVRFVSQKKGGMNVIMTREEWRKWAESLKPGDKVIVQVGGGRLRIGTVKKVTPAGWVAVEKYGTYSQTLNFSRYMERGGYKEIVPFDAEIAEKAKMQEAEEQAYEEKRKIIRDAKIICDNWSSGRSSFTYELAKKIIALADEKKE